MSGEDLFGDRQVPDVRVKPPREWPEPEAPGLLGLAVVGLLGAALAYLFDTGLEYGALFAAGCAATRAARNHRRIRRTLGPLTAALFFAFGMPTVVSPYPPTVRYVFFAVLIGSAVALYAWSAEQ